MIKLSLDSRVKLFQALAYIGFIYTALFQFDWRWVIPSLIFSWLLFLLGASCGLHKYSSHRNFDPKNNLLKALILFASTILTLGSNISWAATDPHSPNTNGAGFLRSVKLWFYYFPTYPINPRIIKDLTTDALHKFFHKHYFKIIIAYVVTLAIIDIKLVCYFYFVPVVYSFTAISYITVLAHNTWLSKFGYKNLNSNDLSFNSKIASLFVPGDGNHNNHHAKPEQASNKIAPDDWDLGYWMVKLLAKKSN
jgi:stearoyl-CoA desaturase (delta-9 desaturase)